MAQQISYQITVPKNYADEIMSVTTFDELLALDTQHRFTGLTVTVKNYIGKTPADFELVRGTLKSAWRLKHIDPLSAITDYSVIESKYITPGFEVGTQDGERYVFIGDNEDNLLRWKKLSFIEDVNNAVDRLVSGATEALDTFKEVEDYLKDHDYLYWETDGELEDETSGATAFIKVTSGSTGE